MEMNFMFCILLVGFVSCKSMIDQRKIHDDILQAIVDLDDVTYDEKVKMAGYYRDQVQAGEFNKMTKPSNDQRVDSSKDENDTPIRTDEESEAPKEESLVYNDDVIDQEKLKMMDHYMDNSNKAERPSIIKEVDRDNSKNDVIENYHVEDFDDINEQNVEDTRNEIDEINKLQSESRDTNDINRGYESNNGANNDAADAKDPSDAGDDVSDADAKDTSDAGDGASDAGDDASDAGDDTSDADAKDTSDTGDDEKKISEDGDLGEYNEEEMKMLADYYKQLNDNDELIDFPIEDNTPNEQEDKENLKVSESERNDDAIYADEVKHDTMETERQDQTW